MNARSCLRTYLSPKRTGGQARDPLYTQLRQEFINEPALKALSNCYGRVASLVISGALPKKSPLYWELASSASPRSIHAPTRTFGR